jgi:hypothetical protein
VRMDHIEALPLPESLKQFIVQGNSWNIFCCKIE